MSVAGIRLEVTIRGGQWVENPYIKEGSQSDFPKNHKDTMHMVCTAVCDIFCVLYSGGTFTIIHCMYTLCVAILLWSIIVHVHVHVYTCVYMYMYMCKCIIYTRASILKD